jgi:hypothetical protein
MMLALSLEIAISRSEAASDKNDMAVNGWLPGHELSA